MQVALLHLDNALTIQRRLRRAVWAQGGRQLDYRDLGPALRLWCRPAPLNRLRSRLAAALPVGFGPALVFSGSGDFHHITPLLLDRALRVAGQPRVTVIHFDNHPDWMTFAPGAHCGGWVGQAARLPQVHRVLTIGVCSADMNCTAARGADLSIVDDGRVELYPYDVAPADAARAGQRPPWATIVGMGEAAFADFLPQRIETEAVYLTIDKDVLRPQDAGTNWDQGRTSLEFLKTLITRVLRDRRLIGADVVGDWSAGDYGGGVAAALLKRGEVMLDQPWNPPRSSLRAHNEAVNLGLLAHIHEAAR